MVKRMVLIVCLLATTGNASWAIPRYNLFANPGGPYVVTPQTGATLDGTQSWGHWLLYSPTIRFGESISIQVSSWSWDIDGNGTYGDLSGSQVPISYDMLTGTFGLSEGYHIIRLKVSGVAGYSGIVDATATTGLTIVPEPATVSVLVLAGVALVHRRRA